MLARKFKNYDNFLFDLDGTVWTWIKTVPGAVRLFQILKHEKKNVYFFTNNMILTRASFARKLTNFGITTKEDKIINPSLSAIKVLKGKKVFVIGEGIVTDLKKAKIKIVSTNPDAVLVTTDRHVNYDKISKASDFIRNGAKFYSNALSGKWVYGNKISPGAGSISLAISSVCDKEPILIGKPSKYMVDVIRGLKLKPSKTIMFGDECKSDIVIGNKLRFDTALVLTGISTKKDYNESKGLNSPTYLLNSIANIIG